MLEYTYKYLSTTVIAIFVAVSLFPFISQKGLYEWWYVYIIPFILIGCILAKYGYKISIRDNAILLGNLFNKNEIFEFQDIRKISILKDSFFYLKTISVRIHVKDGSSRIFHIGTYPSSEVSKLINIVGKDVKIVDLTKSN